MLTEPDVEHAIGRSGLQPIRVAGEGFRDPQGASLEAELSPFLDAAHSHPGRIRDGRQRCWEGAEARLVPGGRDREG